MKVKLLFVLTLLLGFVFAAAIAVVNVRGVSGPRIIEVPMKEILDQLSQYYSLEVNLHDDILNRPMKIENRYSTGSSLLNILTDSLNEEIVFEVKANEYGGYVKISEYRNWFERIYDHVSDTIHGWGSKVTSFYSWITSIEVLLIASIVMGIVVIIRYRFWGFLGVIPHSAKARILKRFAASKSANELKSIINLAVANEFLADDTGKKLTGFVDDLNNEKSKYEWKDRGFRKRADFRSR
ncbi:MAG: hypothetical protein HRU10_01620 [Opitutales bacterium]|nr:hypothetical protein [Opitutales bacterium]